jgi:hypothetical protein
MEEAGKSLLINYYSVQIWATSPRVPRHFVFVKSNEKYNRKSLAALSFC